MEESKKVDGPPAASQRRPTLGEIYVEHAPAVSRYLKRRLQGVEISVVEDLTADVFERAAAAYDRYVDQGPPITVWLYKIAQNILTDYYRRRAVSAGRTSDKTVEDIQDRVAADAGPDPALVAAMKSLPPETQKVALLHWVERRSIEKISARLGYSESHVRRVLKEALKALRGELEAEVEVKETLKECSGLDALAAEILRGHLGFDPPYPFRMIKTPLVRGNPLRPRLFVYE